MYLKNVEIIGFKSFANKTNISFMPDINGVVGPNGCGKSNIIDAIKWVLGEQSTKSLRASGMSDVIFSGSDAYKKLNFAEVSLTFDNSDRALALDFEEVEITRRIYRDGESEYLINKSYTRLKDIVELLMDTGLGKDSLSIISQGAISDFAHSKPIERRAIFEEAAQVAKYKKKKIESLRKLEKTNENLIRINDILSEIEIQLEPLKRQSEKAKKYLEKKERLNSIEVSVIVFEVAYFEEKIESIKKEIELINLDILNEDSQLFLNENKLDQFKDKQKQINAEVESLQSNLLKQIDYISSLEKQKRDEYELLAKEMSFDDLKKLENKLDNLNIEINSINQHQNVLVEKLNSFKDDYGLLKSKYEDLKNNIVIKQNTKVNYQKQKAILEDIKDKKSNLFQGVKTIIEAKNSLNGIVGLVSELFEVDELYQEAISKALQSSLQNVVVETSDDAKAAVKFLKNNQAGRATFIPLNIIKNKFIKEEDLFIIDSVEGYIDVATNLISFDPKYNSLFSHLLNTTIIVKDIDSALKVARAIKYSYRIISLDGEIISVGGMVTGGKTKNEKGNILTIKTDLERLDKQISEINETIKNDTQYLNDIEQDLNNIRNQINQKNISIAKNEEKLSNLEYSFNQGKSEYEKNSVNKYEFDSKKQEKSLITLINDAVVEKDNIVYNLNSIRENQMEINREIDYLEKNIKINRHSLNELKNKLNDLNINSVSYEINHKNHLDRLANEYQLTIDSAKEQLVIELDKTLAKQEVEQLKRQIANLGTINLLAIEEYEKINERFDFLNNQKTDLDNARDELLKIINESDKLMIKKFDQTIKDINDQLPETFKKLFGGGHATLEYSDPSNILETGIEIIAKPPGKSVQSLTLFSGGEKALIALSVLFAILKARPVPVCILDEVEAALDQANVERFANFLHDFSGNTQFIVITHRPGTMEQCDVLYGVTMQEQGVSKLIGVQFEEAKILADEG